MEEHFKLDWRRLRELTTANDGSGQWSSPFDNGMDARSFSAEEVCAIKNEWPSETYSSNSGYLYGHVTGTVFILDVPKFTATLWQFS